MPAAPTAVLVELRDVGVQLNSLAEKAHPSSPSAGKYVRRPLRGIQLKKETFATITVVGGRGSRLANSSAPEGVDVPFTSNFLLQSISEERAEKFQLAPTFGAPFGFFFGEQPHMISCQAVLLNTADFQWEAEWWVNYEQNFRGTRLVDRGAWVTFTYEDVVHEGYLINARTSKGEPNVWGVSLSFTMWVVRSHSLLADGVGAKHVDPIHASQGPTEWDAFDSDVAGAPSMLQEVRARNMAKLTEDAGTGLIGAIRNALNDVESFVDKVGAAIDSAIDWLYGRNLVIPAGFAGSDRIAGSPVFAEGDGAVVISAAGGTLLATQGSITIRSPIRMAPLGGKPFGNFYDDDVDEYVARYASATTLVDLSPPTDPNADVYAAEGVFGSFGINIINETGQSTGELLRQLGTSTFAVISYAATGASAQDAAALMEVASSADYIAAEAEQGAMEALI